MWKQDGREDSERIEKRKVVSVERSEEIDREEGRDRQRGR